MLRLFRQWFLPKYSPEDFDPATELAFQASLDHPRRQSTRTGAALALVLFLSFSLLDVIAIPGALWQVLAIRFLMVAPLLVFLVWASNRLFFSDHYVLLMTIMYLGMGLAIQVMILLAQPHEVAFSSYYAGLVLVVIALYNLTHLRPVHAGTIGFGLVGLYAVLNIDIIYFHPTASASTEQKLAVLVTHLFFLVSANILGLFALMTREYHARELFLLRQHAESLAQVKSAFLANMSHEIRTPLNGVLGLAEMGCRQGLTLDKAYLFFGKIRQAGKLLLTVINDILDYSKIEAGKLDIQAIPFDPRSLAQSAVESMSHAALAKNLTLNAETEGLPSACVGDPVRITQVVFNLLSNAIKFTPSGKVILRVTADDGTLRFAVEDTGPGISPEDQQRLFQSFEQIDNSTTRPYGGTGLGLAISRRLARMMGGDIEVASTLGHGSSFVLRLPRHDTLPAALSGPPTQYPADPRLSGLRVLVAEDNEVNQIVIEDLLVQEGAQVTLALNGQRALDAVDAASDPFDVVLMDVQMPVMDGLEATRRLKVSHPDLPVIGQTAHALRENLEKCLAAGMRVAVTKPMTADALVAAILTHVPKAAVPALKASTDPAAPPLAVTPERRAHAMDWDALRLRYNRRPAFVDKIVAMALKNYEGEAQRLRELVASKNLEAMERMVHTLKGSAGGIMAVDLAASAALALARAQAHHPQVWETAMETAQELDRLVEELRQYRPS